MMEVSESQFSLVYNVLSFTMASMAATTVFCWMRVVRAAPISQACRREKLFSSLTLHVHPQGSIAERYKSALIITGIVTFIASYHYFRIFNSWVEAYEWTPEGELGVTGVPFDDAYRYMDWLLTVPLLLIEIILVMKLDADETKSKCVSLGSAAALMIILGYPGESVLDSPGTRWFWWVLAMIPFLYIVYTLLVGLAAATDSESDPAVRNLIRYAQLATVISWCTYVVRQTKKQRPFL